MFYRLGEVSCPLGLFYGHFSVCTTIMTNESDCGNKSFLVGVGLHQGSTLSRVLFIMKDRGFGGLWFFWLHQAPSSLLCSGQNEIKHFYLWFLTGKWWIGHTGWE